MTTEEIKQFEEILGHYKHTNEHDVEIERLRKRNPVEAIISLIIGCSTACFIVFTIVKVLLAVVTKITQ